MQSIKPILDYSVRIKELQGDYYLVSKNSAWKLNSIGKEIVDLCDGEHTVEEIINKLWSLYENTDEKIIYEDTLELIEYLISEKLLAYEQYN